MEPLTIFASVAGLLLSAGGILATVWQMANEVNKQASEAQKIAPKKVNYSSGVAA
jgi:flagellar basal body-associated protein FliL